MAHTSSDRAAFGVVVYRDGERIHQASEYLGTESTRGRARIHGRVGKLFEVRSCFYPELNGCELVARRQSTVFVPLGKD